MKILEKPAFTLLLLSLSHFLVDFMIGIWPVFKTLANLDLALAGMIYACGALIGEGMQIFFGRLADSGLRKTLILSGIFASSLGAFYGYTQNYVVLSLLFLVVCIGSGAFHPSAVGLVSSLTLERKGTFITFFAMFGSLGLALSQILYAKAFSLSSGETAFLLIPALLMILFSLKKKIYAKKRAAEAKENPSFGQFIEFFKNEGLRRLYFSQICNQAIAWGFIFLLPDVLKVRGYDDWIVFGGGHLVYVLGGVLFLIPSGYMADKYSSRGVIFYASLIGMLFYYAFLFIPNWSDLSALFLLFGMGASISIVNPVSIAFGTKLSPEHPGMISAFLMGLVWCVSECVGPGLGGLMTKLFVEDAPARSLMIMGSLFFFGLYHAYRLPQSVAEQVQAEVEL